MKFLRNLFAALALSFPSFSRGKDNSAEKSADPDLSETKIAPSGMLEAVNKYYGTTIAGGPGSQKIGDTFDALPQAAKDAMIAARKGRIISGLKALPLDNGQYESGFRTGRISRGLGAAIDRTYNREGAKVTPR